MPRNKRLDIVHGFPRTPAWMLALTLVLVLPAGCDDTPSGPLNPTVGALWPNEDGREWSFATTFRVWSPIPEGDYLYPDPDSIPPAPSLDAVVRILDSDFTPPAAYDAVYADYTLRFAGRRVTRSGVEAQNLSAQIAVSGDPTARIPFLPVILHGGAFEKTDSWIGTYGDLDTLAAWIYLDRSLWPGHTFTYQLLRSIEDETFLHARVFPRQRVTVPAGTFNDAVEVVYLVDYGRRFQVSFDGAYGYYRYVTFGNIIFVPGVGPAYSYERRYAPVGRDVGPGEADVTSALVSVTATPPEP
jgi:hypothetical protein